LNASEETYGQSQLKACLMQYRRCPELQTLGNAPKTLQTVSKLSGAPQNAKCAKFMASLVELKVGQVDI
jgi:hypothetical protein